MEPYKHYKPFKDAAGGLDLEEFTDAKEVVQVRYCWLDGQETRHTRKQKHIAQPARRPCSCVFARRTGKKKGTHENKEPDMKQPVHLNSNTQ